MTAPAPLTPPDCDLRGLAFMPLDVIRLVDSDMVALSSGDEFKAAVILWCKAWTQVPAASLPADERVLARLCGVSPKEWRKLSGVALRGWIECSDGRLYHPVVAEKAREAWEERQGYRAKSEGERARKEREREERRHMFETLRGRGQVPAWNTSTSELRRMTSHAPDTDLSRGQVTQVTPPVTQDVTSIEGTGTGTGIESSEAKASAPLLASLDDPDKLAWDQAIPLIVRAGVPEKQARSAFGRLLSANRLAAREMLPSVSGALANSTPDPLPYLTKAAQAVARRKQGVEVDRVGFV